MNIFPHIKAENYNTGFIPKLNGVIFAIITIVRCYGVTQGIGLDTLLLISLILINFNFIINNLFKGCEEWTLYAGILLCSFIGAVIYISSFWFDYTLLIHNLFTIVVFFVALIYLTRRINTICFWNTLLWFSILAEGCCFYQQACLLTQGSFPIDIFFPLPFDVIREIETMTIYRPAAFFTEPAHFAIFMLPAFYASLESHLYFYSVIGAVGILACGSTTGLILLCVVLIAFLLKEGNLKLASFFFLISLGVFFFLYRYLSDFMMMSTSKLAETNSDTNRLLGGLKVLEHFDTVNFIVGIGLNEVLCFARYRGFDYLNNYASSIIFLIISYGFIGAAFMFRYFYRLAKKSIHKPGFFIILFGVFCSDQVMFNSNFLYLITCCLLASSIMPSNKVSQ